MTAQRGIEVARKAAITRDGAALALIRYALRIILGAVSEDTNEVVRAEGAAVALVLAVQLLKDLAVGEAGG